MRALSKIGDALGFMLILALWPAVITVAVLRPEWLTFCLANWNTVLAVGFVVALVWSAVIWFFDLD